MTQLADTSWSPSKTENIVGNREVANAARQSLAWIVSQRLALIPEERHIEVMTLASKLDNLISKFEKDGVAERIAELEAELEQVNVDGEKAEEDFITASNNETAVRNAEAQRLNKYNAATRNLSNIKNEPLPTFHNNKHVIRKLERIADAQAEVDAALADMNAHPLAIPTAVQAKQQAETKVNTLAARARAIHRELAALRGESVDATGQQHSSVGLGGLR